MDWTRKNIVYVVMISLWLAIQATAQAQTPPRLLSPGQGDTLRLNYPLFAWQPVLLSGQTAEYMIRIVEKLEFQSLAGALMSNPPLVERLVGNTTSWVYPLDAPTLAGGKTYAWQVVVLYSGKDQPDGITSSEVQSFYKEEPYNTAKPGLKRKKEEEKWAFQYGIPSLGRASHRFYTYENQLFIQYYNRYGDSLLTYAITDQSGKVRLSSESAAKANVLPVSIKSGNNYLAIDLSGAQLPYDQDYTITIRDQSGSQYLLGFTHLSRSSAPHKKIKEERKKAEKMLQKMSRSTELSKD